MLHFEDSHLIDREMFNKTDTITLSRGKRDCFRKHYLDVALIDAVTVRNTSCIERVDLFDLRFLLQGLNYELSQFQEKF